VANAGYGTAGTLATTTSQMWLDEMRMKVFGAVLPLRSALPWLRRSDSAGVVLIGGASADRPNPSMIATSAARAAVANLTKSLAAQLAPDGVRVNMVTVGVIDTARQRAKHTQQGGKTPYEEWSRAEAVRRGVALGRMGRADEVAAMIAFLLSTRATYLTGADIDVAGGLGLRAG
jgi:NAD(P)-dependent dehydrogenase (short-subunit alcohol dehydrogenase family)